MGGEADILFWIQDHLSCGFLDAIMPTVSLLCTADIIWFLFALTLMNKRETRRSGIVLLIALIISIVITNILLKPLIGRVRPYEFYDVTLLIPASSEYSFPSGHTTGVTVMAGFVYIYFRKWLWPTIIFALTVMFSRMYLFMHYPTDLLGGFVVGLISVALSYVMVEAFSGYVTGKEKDGIQRF